jgi:hypothetical protein
MLHPKQLEDPEMDPDTLRSAKAQPVETAQPLIGPLERNYLQGMDDGRQLYFP